MKNRMTNILNPDIMGIVKEPKGVEREEEN